jgi:hypothetical protein
MTENPERQGPPDEDADRGDEQVPDPGEDKEYPPGPPPDAQPGDSGEPTPQQN